MRLDSLFFMQLSIGNKMSTPVTIINPGNAAGAISVTRQAVPPGTVPMVPELIATLRPGASAMSTVGTGTELVIRQI